MTTENTTVNQANAKPKTRIKVGRVEVAIWNNPTTEGHTFQSITMQKVYRKGEEFKTTDSLSGTDVLAAIEALKTAAMHMDLVAITHPVA